LLEKQFCRAVAKTVEDDLDALQRRKLRGYGDARLCVTPLLETLDDVSRFAFEAIQPVMEVSDRQSKSRDLVPQDGEVTLPAHLVDQ
jgi:hypothetical protein